MRRGFDIVGLSAVSWDAINADFNFGWISEMGLFQKFSADVKGSELGVGRGGAKSALFNVLNLVI